ncbi:MAG: type I restriction enzyme EcoKI subunit R [bacterium ADurb.Bin363]|nr:MAG: type I restriction enzyme EcoKI subunit R [bacterium ADurb.Bin363]
MRRYSRSWRKPKFFEALERLEDTSPDDDREDLLKVAEDKEKYHPVSAQYEDTGKIIKFPRPLGPQIEALYELNKSRLEGWDKGIVVAACGIGKTFLATFDSENFNKVIFIAHREEILSQAEQTFKCVKPEIKTGFFSGIKKESNCDILFATVQTIGRHEYLNENFFKKDEFDYIVVDEFHHAVAGNYRNIINYFKPKFLLGLTATPERLDGQDIFALCDYNLVYEIRLKEAINKGFLVPFRYYGIYDESNYNTVDCKNGRYDEEQLEELLSINKRAELILQHYCKYNSSRALGFCVSRNHAMYMAKYFFLNGIKSCAVISGNVNKNNHRTEMDDSTYIMDRKIAIEKLKNSEIKVIFSVDMFNEGLDVPEVDMVMFLRPTESPTVFLQQLGRGLRKRTGKNYVNILDFIGNYKRANLIPFLLSGDVQHISRRAQEAKLPPEDEYPDDCIVNFDFKLVDLFKDMAEKQKGIFEKVKDEYFRLKEDLGLRPMRLQMYTYIDEYLYSIIRTKKDLNIFRDYFSFLKKVNELTEEENELIGTKAHDFLLEIEKTGMTKTYKMPVLLAFYNNGNIKMSINDEDLYESFKNFYSHGSNYVDLLRHPGSSNYKNWTKKDYVSVARKNPVHFLLQSSPEFFYTDGEKFCLTNSLEKYIDKPAFILHFKDAIDYRTRSFYKERLEKKLLEFEK